jgi:hypothetical protein
MSSDSNFLIEFPADRDCVPFVQDFFRDYLKSFDFSKKFAEHAANESGAWFNSVMPSEKMLHALPSISFSAKCSGSAVQVQIKTSDKKEFITSINAQNEEEA